MFVIIHDNEVVIGPFDTEGRAIEFAKTFSKPYKVRQVVSPVVFVN